ncbi:proton-conducting transporter membrane subunit [uncultured Methanoregula sp.]|uniref:proton-conducting transporter transmembrane domain-containing protein n=1 Tax=uncultured Methanoregula sp. TaxID=1005933 RepID=UPI002AAACA36|nr:proton-conducting transporter membrane subunit [uncultured Methanoregula sp.]
MILIAFIACTAAALLLIAFSHTPGRMNLVCTAQGILFTIITVFILLSGDVPVSSFLAGNQFFFIDHLGIFEILITVVIFSLAAVYARGYVAGLLESGELEKGSLKLFYAAWALLLLIIVLAFCSDNLALFWIFAELTTITSAVLIATLSARENIDAAIKYIFVASIAMLFSFVGLIFLFQTSRTALGDGTLNWTVLMEHAAAFPPGMMVAASALVFIGFAAKSGIFPFHTWLPEAHAKAPSAVSAILSGVLLNVGIYGILRMVAIAHQNVAITTITPLIGLFGVLTIAIAAISMLPQKNLKKLIAFSSVENMGLLLIGIAVCTPLAIFWVLFHVMAHALTKASLFFSAGILHRQYRSHLSSDAVDEIRDVFRLQPLAAWGIILGGLAIIGMPPFPIFFSKLFILLGLGSVSPLVLAVVLVLLFIAAVALGYFVIVAFTQVSPPGVSPDIDRYPTPLSMKVPIVILLGLIVILGLVFTSGEITFFSQIVKELRF